MVTQTPILPLLVRYRGETTLHLLGNHKSYEKSLESGEVWYVHPTTLRVLNLPNSRGCRVLHHGDHYSVEWVHAEPPRWEGTAEPSDPGAPPFVVGEGGAAALGFLEELTRTIQMRHRTLPEGSYTTHLFQKGEEKIRKKTGEEAIELVLARTDQELLSEAADLVYHLMVLLEVRGLSLAQVVEVLAQRH